LRKGEGRKGFRKKEKGKGWERNLTLFRREEEWGEGERGEKKREVPPWGGVGGGTQERP